MVEPNKQAKLDDTPPPCGLLVLDKPLNMSSMGAVARVRRRAGGVKTGHAGTLDPLATGVLVLALGRGATRMIDRLMATRKRYQTTIDLGAFSSTDDCEGDLTSVQTSRLPDRKAIETAVGEFVGEILQRPPAFSAVKVDGRRSYKLARDGQTVQHEARPVVLHEASVTSYDWPLACVELHTGKGFYVRSFARELGERLGVGGYCRSIRRTAVGPFTIETARTLDDLPERIAQTDLIEVEDALAMVDSAREAIGVDDAG